MEDNFYKDEFEMFLKEQAENHRMYPSDGIWRNILKQLHGEKNWPALTIAAFILLVATVGISVHFGPKPNIFAVTPASKNAEAVLPANSSIKKSDFSLNSQPVVDAKEGSWKKNRQPGAMTNKNTNEADDGNNTSPADILNKIEIEESTRPNKTVSTVELSSPGKTATNNITLELAEITRTTYTTPVEEISAPGKLENIHLLASKTVLARVGKNVTLPGYVRDKNSIVPGSGIKKRAAWKKNFGYQVYITPSASYRKLREDHSGEKESGQGPVALNLVADLNQIVRHKAMNGLEAGFALIYNVAPTIRVKTGLQFNMRQYNIEAYKSNTELATIRLTTTSGVDTVNSIANYRTTTGQQAAEIVNRYYQVSVPVGIDWEVMGNDILKLNVGASIQPTYQVNRNAFILSSDLKNYTQVSDMLRPWNINSSLEAYISFKIGNYNWQLGPQVRYQHLPTMIQQYSIKEHLLDYGVKIGVTKPLH